MLKTILSACLTSVRAGREIMQEIFLTLEGKAEKEKRLDYLIHVRRPEVVEKLKAAREYRGARGYDDHPHLPARLVHQKCGHDLCDGRRQDRGQGKARGIVRKLPAI